MAGGEFEDAVVGGVLFWLFADGDFEVALRELADGLVLRPGFGANFDESSGFHPRIVLASNQQTKRPGDYAQACRFPTAFGLDAGVDIFFDFIWCPHGEPAIG